MTKHNRLLLTLLSLLLSLASLIAAAPLAHADACGLIGNPEYERTYETLDTTFPNRYNVERNDILTANALDPKLGQALKTAVEKFASSPSAETKQSAETVALKIEATLFKRAATGNEHVAPEEDTFENQLYGFVADLRSRIQGCKANEG